MSKVKVVQSAQPEEEVPTEVLAGAIVAISQGIKKLRTGRLNDRALILLIKDAAPAWGAKYRSNHVGTSEIRAVLDGIEGLEKAFLRKPVP